MKLFTVFLLLFSFVYSQEGLVNYSEEERLYLKNNPTIKVSSEMGYAPYDFVLNKKPTGYSTELLQLASVYGGYNIKFHVEKNWNRIMELICDNEIDLIHPADKISDINSCLDFFEKPHIIETAKFAVRKDFKNVEKIQDLYGYKVAVLGGIEIVNWFLKNYENKLSPIFVDSPIEGLKAVSQYKADGYIDLFSTLEYHKLNYGISNIKITGHFKELGSYELYYATKKGNPILKSIINKSINAIPTHKIKQLNEKWLNSDEYINSLNKKEQDYIHNNQEIKLCTSPDWLPFDGIKDNKHIGIGADLLKIMIKDTPLKIKIEKTKDWESALKKVKNRKCDIISLAMKSPNREDYLNFTNPFLKVPLVLVAKDDKEFIDDLSKLKNKKIAIINQSVFHEILKKRYPNLEIIGVSNGKEGLDLVKDNKVFGYADALHGIRYTKNANLIDGIETIGMFQESYQLAIGVRKDNETLLRVFDKLSSKISEDVKTKTIQKWSALTQKEELEIKEYLEIFLLLVLALIILFFWSLFLKTKVEEEVEKNQANKQLLFQQSKQAALGDMIANIAHQWKQPLNEISMMQSIILKKNEDGTLSKDEIQKQILDEQRVVKFMSKTIQTFQNFYLKKEKEDLFDIKKSYLEVKELLRKTFELHRIQLIEDLEHIKINGDINMFSQVFLSLFQNSIFFFVSRKIQNPKLWITITREKNKILIKIRDNGGGIKAKKISSVFMFNYSDRDNKEKSLGLGLYTSKMIIEEKFDGFITAKNQEDGAVFTIYL